MTERPRLLDANVMLALHDTGHIHHVAAAAWLDRVGVWATTPITETAFLRLVTNASVLVDTVTIDEALADLRAMRAAPDQRFLPDDTTLAAPQIDLAALRGHKQITDYHLVNLAARHGAVLATFDARLVASLAPADREHVELVPV